MERRKAGRPRTTKVFVNFNRKMELSMDLAIREIVQLMPDKYASGSQFVTEALRRQIKTDKQELYRLGLIDSIVWE